MSKLKPCPFCGGEGCIQEHVFKGYTETFRRNGENERDHVD